ncbi:hypothetical protein GCM10010430_22460 [Kitasatospora cystarginea]|uniref:Uncharacterized protein n=1 Tax=Kitasatospora cystarginea TaxID=58350 RepID=A0ABP5QNG9_9ACTN
MDGLGAVVEEAVAAETVGTGAELDGGPLGREWALDLVAPADGEVLGVIGDGAGGAVWRATSGPWSSAAGVGAGPVGPPDCGGVSASTPAPPRASVTAVTASSRPRRRDLRLLRRLRRASAGPGSGSVTGPGWSAGPGVDPAKGASAEAGAPQPGQDSAPLRWRRQGAQ